MSFGRVCTEHDAITAQGRRQRSRMAQSSRADAYQSEAPRRFLDNAIRPRVRERHPKQLSGGTTRAAEGHIDAGTAHFVASNR
jgi:hypothetical protein